MFEPKFEITNLNLMVALKGYVNTEYISMCIVLWQPRMAVQKCHGNPFHIIKIYFGLDKSGGQTNRHPSSIAASLD